ncbi:MAG: DUF3179 domain-containing protein [Gammaproteobacteria bacterium]|jgi:hypothetical protein|nr:DUF3179 domain-containing protein [Gammaproteobacteria bacterium]
MPKSIKSLLRISITVALISTVFTCYAAPHNGFDLSNSILDTDKILAGGPAKDGIPAIDQPTFIAPKEAVYLKPTDRILGIQLNGISKAYPIAILNWHEIVNDEINNSQFSITYCPLCGTGVAFSSVVKDKILNFGVSGLLYNSDVLLYDRQTESLWSQIKSQAISGELVGQKLTRLPITHTSWSNWLKTHPETLVMSDKTGFSRDYTRDPYSGYESSRATYFQVTHKAPDYYHPKERVLGLEVNNSYKAYPFSEIDKAHSTVIKDNFAGQVFNIHWDKNNQQASITDSSGKEMLAIEGFWFAWFAFHPETEVFKSSR